MQLVILGFSHYSYIFYVASFETMTMSIGFVIVAFFSISQPIRSRQRTQFLILVFFFCCIL